MTSPNDELQLEKWVDKVGIVKKLEGSIAAAVLLDYAIELCLGGLEENCWQIL